jgi:hypothetical protein
MRILVTGASGNFGRGAVRLLLETMPPEDLILMSRKPDRLEEFALLGCTVRQGDFDAPETVEAAAPGADKMLLISGHKVGWRIKQHGDAIEAAKRAGVSHSSWRSARRRCTRIWTSWASREPAETEFNVDGYEWCSDVMVSYEREVGNGRFAIVAGDVETLLGRKPKPLRSFVEERAEQLRGARSR